MQWRQVSRTVAKGTAKPRAAGGTAFAPCAATLIAAVSLAALCGCSLNTPDQRYTAPVASVKAENLPPPAAGTGKSDGTEALKPALPKAANVKVTLLLPLGGFDSTAAVAKAMKQAGEMALFELDNPAVHLVVKDDHGSPEGARAAASEAIAEGAEVILGPLMSRSVAAVAPVAQAAHVPVIAFSNDNAVAGNGVYLMSFLAEAEVDRIVAYSSARGRKRFAALIPDDAYGRAVDVAFRDSVARVGGTIVASEFYPAAANRMIEPVKRVAVTVLEQERAGTPVDALFLPGGQDTLPQLGPLLLSEIDTGKMKLIGTGTWDYPNIGHDKAFVGGWYPSSDPRGFKDFSQRFAKTFGTAPPRLATLAYDAVSAVVAMASAETTGPLPTGPVPNGPLPVDQPRFSSASIERTQGFEGTDGTVRFNAQGLAQRALAVLEVQEFGVSVVDEAPKAAGAALAPMGTVDVPPPSPPGRPTGALVTGALPVPVTAAPEAAKAQARLN